MNDTTNPTTEGDELEIKSIVLEPVPVTRQHEGHTITLTPELLFEVSGPLYTGSRPRECQFDALIDARKDITKRIRDDLTEKAKNQSFSLRIVTDLGEVTYVTKLNRQTGSIDAQCTRYFYPAASWAIQDVERVQEIMKELKSIQERLSRVRMNASRTSGRIDVNSLAFYIDRLQKEYAEKTAEAKVIGTFGQTHPSNSQ
jgi:hypothetical protein